MLDNLENKGSFNLVLISIFAIFLSGIFFGLFYFVLDTLQTQFLTVDCSIPSNIYVESCQELFEWTLYPVLTGFSSIFIWMSYFFIFALVLGMLVVGYRSGKNPATIGFLLVLSMVFTYLAIEISNVYLIILESPALYNLLIPFPVYNQIMINFPWFIGIITLISFLLSIVNFQKSRVNSSDSDLDY